MVATFREIIMNTTGISVVTGGASGIGAACVKHLVQRGDKVVVVDLPGAWKPAKMGVDVAGVYECDVTHDQGLREAAAAIERDHGPVTALVHCAGILQRRLPPDQLPMEEWDRVIAVDQRGTGHVHLLAAAQHAGLRCGLQHLHGAQCGVYGFMLRGAHGATQPVEEGAVRLVLDRVAPALGRMGGDMAGQGLGDGRGVVIGGDLGVTGHGACLLLNC